MPGRYRPLTSATLFPCKPWRAGADKVCATTLPGMVRENMTPLPDSPVMTGRLRQSGGGACLFVW